MKTQHKYTDYAIISGLSGKRTKKEFVSWADTELEIPLEDTPENRVWAMMQILNAKLKIQNNENSDSNSINLVPEGIHFNKS